MENFQRGRFNWQMLELPDGITTSNGNWYHITRDGIENYVPGLLKNRPLERIIQEADAWVKSSDGFSLMLFFIVVFFGVTPWLAAAISLVFYFLWYFNTGVFVNVTSTPIAKLLNKDGVVYGVSAIFLIGISINEITAGMGISVEFNAIWYGLILFFLYKVGLLRLMIEFTRKKFFGQPKVSKEDRILNMLLIRYGMKYGILTGEVNEMEKELVRIVNYHKQKKK
ncbi:MAG: hypothetical protein HUJ22_07820 [Gracilimonas sp.]|uniref:hypothetical protein n=1 Tax=Gracilimonas sp. TaxID=1974203 RepID=UPI0019B0D9BF|nr:hypothetical protein [Gracilimonas sp.]MBD3616465.1 hypothetical protein [Gracilimonas sp.]